MERNAKRRAPFRRVVNLSAKVCVRVGAFRQIPMHIKGRIVSISRGGARIAVPAWAARHFYVGRPVDVTIEHAPMAETPLHSKVVWMRESELGVRFLRRAAREKVPAAYQGARHLLQ